MSASLHSTPASKLAESLSDMQSRIEAAALRHGRSRGSVNLLAVTKTQPASAIRAMAMLGQRDFGESYLQEAVAKRAELNDLDVIWHFIGQIQSNKTHSIAEQFDWVHTVDRLKVAQRLNDQRSPELKPLNICIQIKFEEEIGKGGVAPVDVLALARAVAPLSRLRLRGLMCIPPPKDTFEQQIAYFREAAELLAVLQREGLLVDTLSMGMSADLEAAIAAGATIVRVGTALFGERINRDARRETRDASE